VVGEIARANAKPSCGGSTAAFLAAIILWAATRFLSLEILLLSGERIVRAEEALCPRRQRRNGFSMG